MSVYLASTGLWVAPHQISNEELVSAFNTYVVDYNLEHAAQISAGTIAALQASSSEFIEKASGIQSRYVLERDGILNAKRLCPKLASRPDDAISVQAEMSLAAIQDALSRAGRTGSEVDCLIVACSNLQRPYPAIAIEIQEQLGAKGFAYDMNVACSSATFGLQAAYSALATGTAQLAVVVNPEICSAHLNFRDRDSHFIFGDVCTAMVLQTQAPLNNKRNNSFKIHSLKLSTQFSNNIRNNFGFLNRTEQEDAWHIPTALFTQNGRKVFKEVVPLVADHILAHLEQARLPGNDLKRFWLHQANLSMNQLIAKRILGREATLTEAPVILDRFANTSSAGSVIALHQHQDDLAPGSLGMLCSFGAGYSVGSVLLEKV